MKQIPILLLVFILVGGGCTTIGTLQKNQSDIAIPQLTDTTSSPKNKTLNLSNQNLESLPKSVLQQTNMTELDISENNMTGSLPAEIGHLKNLTILNASNNQFTGIPAEVGQLINLEVLNFSNNQITGIPYELGNLSNLKILDLSENDYSSHDLKIIQATLPADVDIRL